MQINLAENSYHVHEYATDNHMKSTLIHKKINYE